MGLAIYELWQEGRDEVLKRGGKDEGAPVNIPLYFFITEGSVNTIIPEWKAELSGYISEISFGEVKVLDSEYQTLHYEKSDLISDKIEVFLKEIQSKE